MSTNEGENSEFDQLEDLFAEDSSEADPLAELDAGDDEDLDIAPEAVDGGQPEGQEEGKSEKKRKKKKKLRKKDGLRVDAEEDGKEGGGLLAAIAAADVFTVILGLALLAIVIAVFCLWMELREYEYKIKAPRPVVMTPATRPIPLLASCSAENHRAASPDSGLTGDY